MPEQPLPPYARGLRTVRRYGAGAAGVGLVLAIGCLFLESEAFFRGYLTAYLFWVGLSLGCLVLLMIHHLTAGGWGFVMQRHLEAGALTVGGMALLFVPVLFGLHALYPWTDEAFMASEAALRHKLPYLNEPFYIGRTVLYFAFWMGAAVLLRRWSLRLGETGEARYVGRLRALAAAGLIGHLLLLTFATVDWAMSLDPHWYSTIFCWMMAVSQTLAAIAFTILVLVRLRRRGPLAEVARTKHLHDYGNLLLAFVILWTYMMFAQYLIMWSGNLPHDAEWYVRRNEGAWAWITPLLMVLHFAIPFVLLLSRRTKRRGRMLVSVAGGLLAVHVVFLTWLVVPAFEDLGVLTWLAALGAFVGLGGLWMAMYAWLLGRRPVLPRRDPRFEEILSEQA